MSTPQQFEAWSARFNSELESDKKLGLARAWHNKWHHSEGSFEGCSTLECLAAKGPTLRVQP